jgi:roadblock/LC7 domain-containing protein
LDEDPADFAAHFQVDGVPAYLVYSPEGKLEFKAGKIEELKQELARRTAAAP